jgi:hypothetical protein
MSACRYRNDINKTIHFEKNCINVGRRLRYFSSVYSSRVKKYYKLCSAYFMPEKSINVSIKKCYSDFRDWCNKKNVKTVWENVVLVYLLEKSKILKSSSLRSRYSMLKLQLNIRDGNDVTKFLKLIPLKKKQNSWVLSEKV